MSAAVVDCAIEIDRSPEDVFGYVTDIGREFEWNPRTRRVVKLTDGPIGAGTRWEGEWVAGDPMLRGRERQNVAAIKARLERGAPVNGGDGR
jgi:hypothetical protein